MKQCPACQNTYTDESLKYCLSDGTSLIALADQDQKTVAFREPANRVDIPIEKEPPSVPTFVSPKIDSPPEKKSNWAIIAILAGLLVIVIAGFAGFAAYVYFKPAADKTAANSTATQSPSPANTQDPNLQEKIANLEQRLEDQLSTPTPAETKPEYSVPKTARANSPADGFLALRSQPNTTSGERLAKIPHGARFTVIDCPAPTNPGKMRGRWCRVNYDGIEGWAFDAYMIFE